MRVIRVFPRRTEYTPTDDMAFVGDPLPMLDAPEADEVHVSCCFTWDKQEAERLAEEWAAYTGLPVLVGGPAYDDPGGEFVPGMYVQHGISISSRGCPNGCAWCFVPKREGKLRLLPICPGNIVQDNNVLAWPQEHFDALIDMLRQQKRMAVFRGGLESRLLQPHHVESLLTLKTRPELWLAADTFAAVSPLKDAVAMLAGWDRRKLRCYTMIGRESIEDAESRLEAVWDAGCLPFAQLYRDDAGGPTYSTEWRRLMRKWARPAAMFAAHAECGGE